MTFIGPWVDGNSISTEALNIDCRLQYIRITPQTVKALKAWARRLAQNYRPAMFLPETIEAAGTEVVAGHLTIAGMEGLANAIADDAADAASRDHLRGETEEARDAMLAAEVARLLAQVVAHEVTAPRTTGCSFGGLENEAREYRASWIKYRNAYVAGTANRRMERDYFNAAARAGLYVAYARTRIIRDGIVSDRASARRVVVPAAPDTSALSPQWQREWLRTLLSDTMEPAPIIAPQGEPQ